MRLRWLALTIALHACANTAPLSDGGAPPCEDGARRCEKTLLQTCIGQSWQTMADCGAEFCSAERGCLPCEPSTKLCKGQDAYQCGADGSLTKLETCAADRKCVFGECKSFCDLLSDERSNVGCEFWAVDLPNEYSYQEIPIPVYSCAACQQFAVAVANTSPNPVAVVIEINEAGPGEPLQLKRIAEKQLGPEALELFNLPMREVDCSEWQTDAAGRLRRVSDTKSCLSSRAFRITTNYPVVAYQLNPLVNQFSNGASLLIPTNGLDLAYSIMGWSTTNPLKIDLPGVVMEGIPDYASVTVVGVEPDTDIEVTLAHQIQASPDGKIPAAKKGDTIKLRLGPFDVATLTSLQDAQSLSGDMTGTSVHASKPVVVFSSTQRSEIPLGNFATKYKPAPVPQPEPKASFCCTEHFEQQMFPISSLGTSFAISRSPVRCAQYPEPDFYRILATKDDTKVLTNLSDFPTFTLKAGEVADFWAATGFVIDSSKPIMIGQYTAGQDFLVCDATGDPEFIVFPPAEQHRKEYIFLTPTTFDKDYVVIAAPESASVALDGEHVNDEFDLRCKRSELGSIKGKRYRELHCPLSDGVHRVVASEPVGITVYGYYSVGSYGYPGGADLKQINID
jgi:hypothetical protein